MNIFERIAALRDQMKLNQIDAYLITGTDPHLSEYTPDAWKTREWISGFTGSFGKVLVTRKNVLLWTDTRYFIQAIDEISQFGIELMKDRVSGSISLEHWISMNLLAGEVLAVDGKTLTVAEALNLSDKIAAKGIQFNSELDLVSSIWVDRPSSGPSHVVEHAVEYAGRSRVEKLNLVRQILAEKNLDGCILSALDDIAWLLNIRGNEIQYTPLVTAYCYLDQEDCLFFIQGDRLSKPLYELLIKDGITFIDYSEFYSFLARIPAGRIQIDPIRTNYSIFQKINVNCQPVFEVGTVTRLKAIKNNHEIEQIKNAHLKDGAAMVNSIFWITQYVDKKELSEVLIGRKLNEFRSLQPGYAGESFHPIVGYGAHGAIVHYHATEATDSKIKSGNILLIDSGGQYLDGTTDITRTIILGSPSHQQKVDFTICLKAHIALATAVFPAGTRGYSLDTITRKPLWDNYLNYGHGTGHGIGFYLSVHEGPMSIRSEYNDERIEAGHLMSNEPGLYREKEYGIRTENVLLCKHSASGPFGDFLCFETISLCPIDKQLILPELMNDVELNWLNDYHALVFHSISPLLQDECTIKWLKIQCEPILVS